MLAEVASGVGISSALYAKKAFLLMKRGRAGAIGGLRAHLIRCDEVHDTSVASC